MTATPPPLFASDYLTVTAAAPADSWLVADWHGPQNMASVQAGGAALLRLLAASGLHQLFNDNTRVTTMWSDGAEWAGREWFPAMEAAGLRHLAWVYPADVYASLSIDLTLQFVSGGVVVGTFLTPAEAEAWLRAQA